MFFQKEFAKDVKKINQKPKKQDLVDKLIDGDVELVEFIQQMETKNNEKKHKGGKQKN